MTTLLRKIFWMAASQRQLQRYIYLKGRIHCEIFGLYRIALQPTPGDSNPLQPTPTHSNPLQATPTHSRPLQPTPTNSSHFNPLHAALTHCRPLHLLQTTLETQPHAIRNHSWLPNTLRKFLNFIYLFFNSKDWINHLNHYLEKIP